MQRFISDRKRTGELTAQVAQLRRELEATWAIKREFPVTSVIVATIHENPDYLFEVPKAGAAGYVLKDATQEEVIIAVLQVIGGESPLNPALVNQPAKQPGGEQNKECPRGGPPSEGSKESPESLQRLAAGLTGREIEVVGLLAQGHTTRVLCHRRPSSEWLGGGHLVVVGPIAYCDKIGRIIHHL
jgi:DNA-binding NarL/FixJ family response regulator